MAKTEVMLWNKDKTRSVRASLIRNFMITHATWEKPGESTFVLYGWYNKHESFLFGEFDNPKEAQTFLTNLHKQIEGR